MGCHRPEPFSQCDLTTQTASPNGIPPPRTHHPMGSPHPNPITQWDPPTPNPITQWAPHTPNPTWGIGTAPLHPPHRPTPLLGPQERSGEPWVPDMLSSGDEDPPQPLLWVWVRRRRRWRSCPNTGTSSGSSCSGMGAPKRGVGGRRGGEGGVGSHGDPNGDVVAAHRTPIPTPAPLLPPPFRGYVPPSHPSHPLPILPTPFPSPSQTSHPLPILPIPFP